MVANVPQMNHAAEIKKELRKSVNRGIQAEIAAKLNVSEVAIHLAVKRGDPRVLRIAAQKIAARRRKAEREARELTETVRAIRRSS